MNLVFHIIFCIHENTHELEVREKNFHSNQNDNYSPFNMSVKIVSISILVENKAN